MCIDGKKERVYNFNINIEIPPSAAYVLETLRKAGEDAYVVGGCVRDVLRGVEPHDWDVCTSAPPERTMEIFPHAAPTGLKHGTVTVICGGEPVEVTTFRTEGEYRDGRRPDSVTFVNDAESDLGRRDFTVNAMAWSPERGLLDPFGGREDLAHGVLRAVGDPRHRFTEDALRILRALRFASVCGFSIEEGTADALRTLAPLMRRLAAERVTAELRGFAVGKYAGRVLREYREVLAVCLPSLASVGKEASALLERERSGDGTVRLALLCADADIPLLRLDRPAADELRRLHRMNMLPLPESVPDMRRLLGCFGAETVYRYLSMKEAAGADVVRARKTLGGIIRRGDCCTVSQLAVGGRELLALGAEGRRTGEVLKSLCELVIADRLPNVRDELIAAAREMLEMQRSG